MTHADRPALADQSIRLRVLATSDLHAHLFPFNYYTDRRDDGIGLAGAAGLIEDLRSQAPNSLVLDNGDTLQGAPLGDAALARIMPQGRTHPMIAAMNGIGYDAATLGNHDFDYGLSFLDMALADAEFPIVLGNMRRVDGSRFLPGHVILERGLEDAMGQIHALRIGITGVLPPQTLLWNKAHLDGFVDIDDMVDATRRELGDMRAAGADLVIVLAHCGMGDAPHQSGAENAAAAIAALDGVDAVVAGHTHRIHPESSSDAGLIGDTPVVQPGSWGSHLGVIDLHLTRSPTPVVIDGQSAQPRDTERPAPGWTVTEARAAAVPIAQTDREARAALRRSLRRHPRLRTQMWRDHRETRSYSGQPLGRSAVPLETFFSMIAPCSATQIVADAQRAAAAALVGDDAELSSLPLISAVAPFKAGGNGGPDYFTDIAAGPLMLRHAADLYIYPNALSVLCATGAQVRAWLERSVSVFRRIDPDDPEDVPQPLIDPDFACYNFDRLDGLDYEIDVSRPALSNADGETVQDGPGRITDLRYRGGPAVAPDDRMLVVTNSYRAGGGGNFPSVREAETVIASAEPVREALVAYITRSNGPVAPCVSRNWRFRPLGGAAVAFDTGPGARAHAARAAALKLSEPIEQADGMLRYSWRI